MKYYRTNLMIVSFMTYMIMAGLLTQVGIIIGPMSQSLDISITSAASIFSYLTGGTLLGTFISMVAYSKYEIKQIFRFNYILFLLILALLAFMNFNSPAIISFYLFILGACCGIGLSGGAVIISKIFNEEKRASAFIATDCAFSAAGFIFPTMATILIAKNIEWTSSYGIMGIIVAFVLISTFIFKYPEENTQQKNSVVENDGNKESIISIRVLLMGLSLCLYLFAQSTFLTWAPNYLQVNFGLTPAEAGSVVGNYWGPSVFGLITAAILVNKISARYMLIFMILAAIIISSFLNMTQNSTAFLTATLFFGFFTSCIYKLGISVGSQQIKKAPAILVTFLLTCGTIGSTIAPALSALIVENFGVASAMLLTTITFLIVCISVVICLILEKLDNLKNCKEII